MFRLQFNVLWGVRKTKPSESDATLHVTQGKSLAFYLRGVLLEIQCLQDRKEYTAQLVMTKQSEQEDRRTHADETLHATTCSADPKRRNGNCLQDMMSAIRKQGKRIAR